MCVAGSARSCERARVDSCCLLHSAVGVAVEGLHFSVSCEREAKIVLWIGTNAKVRSAAASIRLILAALC